MIIKIYNPCLSPNNFLGSSILSLSRGQLSGVGQYGTYSALHATGFPPLKYTGLVELPAFVPNFVAVVAFVALDAYETLWFEILAVVIAST